MSTLSSPAETNGDNPAESQELINLRAEVEKYQKQTRDNVNAAKQLAALQDESRTAEQKAADAKAQADQTLAAANLQLLRYEVAEEKGLPLAHAKRLVGLTREELLADADDFASTITTGTPAGPSLRPPTVNNPPVITAKVPDPTKAENLKDFFAAII